MSTIQTNRLQDLAGQYGTPLHVYDSASIESQAARIQKLRMPHGFTVRYAMKANPHPDIIKLMQRNNIAIDASSSYEVDHALGVGVAAKDILLTSQQRAHNLDTLVKKGVLYNATSLHQLKLYGEAAPGGTVGIRVNPGIGSGHSKKTTVGGPTSSFGIWHEYLDDAQAIARQHNLTIGRIHTHIGSGTDPAVWKAAVNRTMEIVERFPLAKKVNFGGGFKVARAEHEAETPTEHVGEIIAQAIEEFEGKFHRKMTAELEPGTFFVANAGVLVAAVDDIVDTGAGGYQFVKLNTGMNDILRPTLYGAQHPIQLISQKQADGVSGDVVFVGHNCESGDVLTVSPHDPEELRPTHMDGIKIGSLVAIHGTGAYCGSMSAHGYNGFPSADEILV